LENERLKIIISSVFFVLGFSLVFSVLGVLLQSVLSDVAYDAKNILNFVAGALIIFFGLLMTGILKLDFLQREHKLKVKKTGHQYATSFLFGGAFAIGWTPCVGAILGFVLSLAITEPAVALPLMISYSLGLGIPFILAAVFISRTTGVIKKLIPYLQPLNLIFGIIIILLGILILTNTLSIIASIFHTEELLLGSSPEDLQNFEQSGFFLKLAIAFLAGLASFVSPCILPIVPAYLTFIAGSTLKDSAENKK
tara:strand:+ start:12166 stop:12924 length:759 start_codon:yes stop_codon:yes gene_type:complete